MSYKISIIIPTYNRAKILLQAINSVINQTYSNWELIIIDDGSTDNTSEVVKPYLRDSRIFYKYQNNSGVTVARNLGAETAEGDILTFLDSDDMAKPIWLELFWKQFEVNERLLVSFLGYENEILTRTPSSFDNDFFKNRIVLFLAGTFAIKRSLYIEIGGYDEYLTYSENWELGFRILLNTTIEHHSYSNEIGMFYNKNEDFNHEKISENIISSTYHILNKHTLNLSSVQKVKLYSSLALNLNRTSSFSKASFYYFVCFFRSGRLQMLYNSIMSFLHIQKPYSMLNKNKEFHKSRNVKYITIKEN